jgi:hypothetical protein
MAEKTVYQENGYENRKEYIKSLAEEYGLSFNEVAALANLLGKDEDFDGLVSACEDAQEIKFSELGVYNF